MKKRILACLTALMLCLALAACNQAPANSSTPPANSPSTPSDGSSQETPPPPVETVKIRAAYHPNLGPMSIPGIDAKMGYFAEEGLEVEWLKFTSGAPEIAAMASGDLQFGYIGQGALKLCAEGQADVVSLSHLTNSEAILV